MKSDADFRVVVEAAARQPDGRLRVTLLLDVAAEAPGGRRVQVAVPCAEAPRGALAKRIVAHVPELLLSEFDARRRDYGVSRSRVLLGRISRYIDHAGGRTGRPPPKRKLVPAKLRTGPKKIIQIIAPAKQVAGFDVFCREIGIQKDIFFINQMRALVELWDRRAASAQ